MSFYNEITPVAEEDLPRDLYDAYLNARFYIHVPLRLFDTIREREAAEWIPQALRIGDMIGSELKRRHRGRTLLPGSLLVEFAALGHRFSAFGLHAPSTHEWAPMFARAAVDAIWDGMESEPRKKNGGNMSWGFYFSGTTENPLSTRSVGNTYVPLGQTLEKYADRIEAYVKSVEVPDEGMVYSNLKSEACMIAARRESDPRPTRSRLRGRHARTAGGRGRKPLRDGPVTSDFRSFRIQGRVETFTPSQAAVLQAFWDARTGGAEELSGKQALQDAGLNSERLRDVFKARGTKMHPAFARLFRDGSRKGLVVLNVRDSE